jgi:hypothetical protein
VRVRGRNEVGVELGLVVAVQVVPQLVAELGEEASLDEGRRGGIDAFFALSKNICKSYALLREVSVEAWVDGETAGRERTWPPENPTATTASSPGCSRNLDLTMVVSSTEPMLYSVTCSVLNALYGRGLGLIVSTRGRCRRGQACETVELKLFLGDQSYEIKKAIPRRLGQKVLFTIMG